MTDDYCNMTIVWIWQEWTCRLQEAQIRGLSTWVTNYFTQYNNQKLIMKGLCQNISKRVSSKKFYEIVRKQKDRIIPRSAEEVIISKYLKDSNTSRPQSNPSPNKRANSKAISYSQIISDNPNGSILSQQYKGIHLSLMSLNYRNINLADIYNVCEKANPDLILVQARPQAYLQHFQLLPKIGATFSDRKYLQQITLTQEQIKKQILSQPLNAKLQSILEHRDNKDEKVFIRDNKDLIDDDVVMMVSYYAQKTSTALMFGELPQQPFRQWFCNSHTLMELQEIFKHTCKNIPFYESLQFSPYRLGALLKPNLFLNIRDRYIATLVEMAIATKKYKKVLCILGIGENQAVNDILQKEVLIKEQGQVFTPILEYLIAPEIRHSLLRNIQGWQIIQKHLLLDILHYGQEIANEPLQSFTTTNKIMQHYGVDLHEYSEDMLMRFRYDKTMGYLQMMREQVRQGEGLKRKFMMREAIRSNA